MDSPNSKPSLVNRLVSGIKDKTVKLAESKLKLNFSDEVPEESILGLVASAVRLGAQRLEVRVEGINLVLTHDGRKLTEAEASQLARGVQSLPELSKGMRIHLTKDEGQIDIHFLTETGMACAKYKGLASPALSQADLGDLQLAKMTTRIVLKGTGNYRRVNQAMGNELPEISLIRKRCFLAPLEIIVSGKPLDRYGLIPESIITGTNFENQHHPTLSSISSTPSQGIPSDLSKLRPHMRAINGGICGIARSAADAGWLTIENGIARPLRAAWPSRTWGYLVLADGGDNTTLEREIQVLFKTLTTNLFLAIQTNVSSQADDALSFLEQNRNLLTEAGHSPVDQDRVFLQLRETISPSSDPRVLNNRLELASSLEASGDTAESERLYAEVLPVWESEALNHFDKYRYEQGATLWQRALTLREKLGTDPNELADKYLRLAEIGKDQRLGFAEQAFRKCLQFVRNCGVENKEREYTVLLGLAQVLKKNRVLTESLKLAEEAEKTMLKLHDGKETKALVPVLKLQAEIFDLNNDYGRSTEFEQRAMLLKFKR